MQRCEEAAEVENFASMALPLAKFHCLPLQFWLKKNYKNPADLFKWLNLDSEATQALHWWWTFKQQPKSICKSLIEEVVSTDASKKGYGGHMNNLHLEAGGLQRRAETPTSISCNWKHCGSPVKVWGRNGGRPCKGVRRLLRLKTLPVWHYHWQNFIPYPYSSGWRRIIRIDNTDRQHNDSGLSVEGERTSEVWETFGYMLYQDARKLRRGAWESQPATDYSNGEVLR